MENSDAANIQTESLNAQYNIVKKVTNTSHVQEYGTIAFSNKVMVSAFLGSGRGPTPVLSRIPATLDAVEAEVVSSRDVDVAILKHNLEDAVSDEDRQAAQAALAHELAKRGAVRGLFEEVIGIVAGADSVERHMNARLQSNGPVCVETCTQVRPAMLRDRHMPYRW